MKDALTYEPTKRYDWRTTSLPDLVHMHVLIVDEMEKQGMAGIPPRANSFAGDQEAAYRAVRELDKRVKDRVLVQQKKEPTAEGAPAPEKTAAPKRGAGKKAPKRKPAAAETAKRSAAPERDEGETKMATSKATKARKSEGRGGSKKAQANARTAYAPDAKIHVLPEGKVNPRREKTAARKNYDKILAASGKTFAYYVEKGGRTPTLTRAVKEKLVKVA